MRTTLPRISLSAVLALLVATLFAGCLNKAEVRGITVQLVDVSGARTASGAELTLRLHYLNENLVGIAADGARHRVTIGGVTLGRVENKQPIGLPQMGSDTQEVKVQIDSATADRLRALQASGVANYEMESTILISAGETDMQSRGTSSGTVSLAQLQL